MTNNAERELLPCQECGMPVASGEYHPYAACLMFMACHNEEAVRDNLSSIARAQASGVPDTCKYCCGSGRQMNDSGELVPCNCKTVTPPKSASVPVERLEALERYPSGIQTIVLGDDLDELIAEYKS